MMISAPAIAADMPVKASPVKVDLPYNWSGFYIGGGVGGVRTEANRFMPDLPIVGIPPTTFTAHSSDLIYNVHAGAHSRDDDQVFQAMVITDSRARTSTGATVVLLAGRSCFREGLLAASTCSARLWI